MIYKPKYFRIEELVPPNLVNSVSHDRLWWALDWRVLWTADRLREMYGPMSANTYVWGGPHKERGLRDPMSKTGSLWSQHKFGRALDLVPRNTTAAQIRHDIINNPKVPEFAHITCIEMDVGWLHFDVRNWEGDVLKVYP